MTRAESLSAPAKINLFLHVGQKRADGFHALQSLVAFTEAGDDLTFAPAQDLSLKIEGPFAAALAPEADNLVLKAGRALQAYAGSARGAAIVLCKNLPVASGIGGGSADCAATLRGLTRLWDLPLSPEMLCGIAATLGSDVPVCVASRAQWMEGRGEILTPLQGVPALPAVLVNPGVGVPTAKVFAALETYRGVALPLPPVFKAADDLIAYLKTTANDLEAPARQIAPAIGEVLVILAGQKDVLLARMSGSGATCFALFGNDAAAEAAAKAIRETHPRWWAVATKFA